MKTKIGQPGDESYIQYTRLTWSLRQTLMQISTDRSQFSKTKVTVPDLVREAVEFWLKNRPTDA